MEGKFGFWSVEEGEKSNSGAYERDENLILEH